MPQDLIRVCQEWFPRKNKPEWSGFLMDIKLKQQIDIAVKNVINDWDFTILITGGGEVRVGKSVLALQIMCYWTYQIEKVHGIQVPFSIKENLVFQWEHLIEKGNNLGQKSKYCALCYDEAGETMEGTKTMSKELKAVRDYLRECGQYNFLNILVLPEFFDLPKGIAVTRSIFLIDVFYTANDEGIFQRGFFKFYSRRNKKKLYLKGKRELDYNAHKFNFQGEFRDFYPINEEEYRESKREALRERESGKADRTKILLQIAWDLLIKKLNIKQVELREMIQKNYGVYLPQATLSENLTKLNERLLQRPLSNPLVNR